MTSAALFAGPVTPPAPLRATLEEWKAKLESLIERRRQCIRQSNRQLSVHLASAIECAHAEIGDACQPARAALIGEAMERIAPYFERPGDARLAALRFPAVVDFQNALLGRVDGDSLDALTDRARQTVEMIDRILAGREVWRYRAGDE